MLHEINIPIATIKANIDMLKRKESNEKTIKKLERIYLATNSLQKQHEKLKYLIKKEVSSIEKENINLSEMIIELIEDFKIITKREFVLNLQECYIIVDKIGLREAIINIISNAIKYSKKEIEITLKNSILEIKDYGIGIASEKLLNIYEKYYQGNSKIEGNGIGLHLVKAFCDKENIDLKIESKENQFTKVILDFNKLSSTKK